jgi:AcrR family transcriptional regulator
MTKPESPNFVPGQMKMSELSEKASLKNSTIRHYLKLGLLHKPLKTGRTVSLYNEGHLKRLNQIKRLKEKKLPLSRIQELLRNKEPPTTQSDEYEEGKKERIINKAVELFSKNGFVRTRISDIADTVGLGKATFYFYFKSKKELFMECADRLVTIIVPEESWDDIRNEPDYITKQRKRGIAFLKAFPNFSGILNSLRISLRGNDPKLAEKAKDTFRTLARPAIKDLRRAVKDGVVREIDEDLFGYFILGTAESLGYALMMGSRYTIEEGIELFLDFIGKGILLSEPERSRELGTGVHYWVVKDLKGNQIIIKDITIGGKPNIVGKLGEGELWIQLENVASISTQENGPMTSASVTMRNGDQVRLEINGDLLLSGESRFGKFLLPLRRVSQVTLASTSQESTNIS